MSNYLCLVEENLYNFPHYRSKLVHRWQNEAITGKQSHFPFACYQLLCGNLCLAQGGYNKMADIL